MVGSVRTGWVPPQRLAVTVFFEFRGREPAQGPKQAPDQFETAYPSAELALAVTVTEVPPL